jgi:hypothetical protein
MAGAWRVAPAAGGRPEPSGAGGEPLGIPGLDPARDALTGLRDTIEGGASGLSDSLMRRAVEFMASSLLQGAEALVDELGGFVDTTVHPDPLDPSLVGADGTYQTLTQISIALMAAFIALSVVHGILIGEPLQALARLVRDVPLAVLAVLAFPWVLSHLVDLADGISATVLPSGDAVRTLLRVQLLETMQSQVTRNPTPAVVTALLTYIGTLLIYLELIVRVVALRLVEALAPLSFAPMVWPPARGAARKVLELTAALILAEPVTFVAIKEGLGLLDAHASTNPPTSGGAWGQLLLGMAVLGVAAFCPFIIWRLMPHVEAMVALQGLSRAPLRGLMSGLQTAYWASAITSRGSRQTGPSRPPPSEGRRPADVLGRPRSLPPLSGSQGIRPAAASTGLRQPAPPPVVPVTDPPEQGSSHGSGASPGWRRRPPAPDMG